MKQFSNEAGFRIFDVLDFHWYPEAKGDHRITSQNATSENDKIARIQAPRTLWDSTYFENSWIGDYCKPLLPLLQNIQKSIDTWYPNTKISITEWNYGGEDDISGGIAFADVLGIFGKYSIYAASYWKMWNNTNYTSAAFKIFRNYDGNNKTFGSISVYSKNNNAEKCSIYASQVDNNDSTLHVIIINKTQNQINADVSITSSTIYDNGIVWGFDANSSDITNKNPISTITNNRFTYTLPPLSVYHMILDPVVTSIHATENFIQNFNFIQNTNNEIICSFVLNKTKTVRITLYNISGQKIANIYNGLVYSSELITTSPITLKKGVYIAEIKTDNITQSKKIIIN
jgi:mannan endo-1,4-beta-mannosidase